MYKLATHTARKPTGDLGLDHGRPGTVRVPHLDGAGLPPPQKHWDLGRKGLGFRVWGLGLRVWGEDLGLWGSGFRVEGLRV